MKYLLILLLVGCGGGGEQAKKPTIKPAIVVPVEKVKYIVAGQSNAYRCDWSYFEDITESEVVMLAIEGASIEFLTNAFPAQEHLINGNEKAILFVHGEADSIAQTKDYTAQVEAYRIMLGDLPLLISTVGVYNQVPNSWFDAIRNEVKSYVNINWSIAFDDAQYFPNWGMLSDNIHFTQDGCIMMMDAMIEATYKLGI